MNNKQRAESKKHTNLTPGLKIAKPRGLFTLVAIISISLYLLRNLWQPGFPQITDGEYHLARIANFYLALTQGQFPPRWAPTFLSGLGNPVFNYNYPLFNFVASGFLAMGVSVTSALKLVLSLSLISAGLGMYTWLSSKFSQKAALLASLVYIASPYMQLDIYVRGNIGEVVCMGLLPWVFLAIEKTLNNQRSFAPLTTLLIACLLLVHNITGILGLVVVVFIVTINYSYHTLPRLILPMIVSVLLASFFWIPALGELSYVGIANSTLNQGYARHFMNVVDILRAAPVNASNSFQAVRTQLGYGLVTGLIITILVLLRQLTHSKPLFYKEKLSQKVRFVISWLVVALGSIYLVTPQSHWLWQLIAPLRYVQHPTRFLLFATLASCVLIAWLIHYQTRKFISVVIVIGAIVNVMGYGKPPAYINYEDSLFYEYPLSSSAAEEFNPIAYDPDTTMGVAGSDKKVQYLVASGSAELEVEYWHGSSRAYRIQADEPVTLVERTLYFPGWETKIDTRLVNNNADEATYKGLINYQIPAGNHRVTTQFTQNTTSRRIGNTLSIMGIVGWLGLFILSRKNR